MGEHHDSIENRIILAGEQPNIQMLAQELAAIVGCGETFELTTETISDSTYELGNADIWQLTIDFVVGLMSSATYDAILAGIAAARRRGRVKSHSEPPESDEQ